MSLAKQGSGHPKKKNYQVLRVPGYFVEVN